MMRALFVQAGLIALLSAFVATTGQAQGVDPRLPKMFYYPYHYFPHNYWPNTGPKWPEQPGQPYMPPPAYMANPPFKPPHWILESQRPQRYHSGFHFWLDQF